MVRVTATMTFEDLPSLLRVKEAALWLGMHRNRLYALMAEGQIPSFPANRSGKQHILIRKDDLKRWLETTNPS